MFTPIHGLKENLDRVLKLLDLYCKASGSKINWNKTYLIWASEKERNWTWGEAMGVKWLKQGEYYRYLGVPMGFRVPQSVRNEKVLTLTRDALIYWSSRSLSQAGRLLVSNQVILASLWYLAATADVGSKTLKIAQGLVRDYLCSGKEGRTRARVAWDAAIAPTSLGGLKIIDPLAQTQALLVKFMIKGLQEEGGAWRILLKHRVDNLRPAGDNRWPPGRHWLMTAKNINKEGSTLWGAVWRSWRSVRPGNTNPATKPSRNPPPTVIRESMDHRRGRDTNGIGERKHPSKLGE